MFVGLYINLSVQVVSAGGWETSRPFCCPRATTPARNSGPLSNPDHRGSRPRVCYRVNSMKSPGQSERRDQSDFYTTTLAPLQHGQRALRIHAVDVLMMTVLFLEMAVLVRFLLAN